PCSAGCAEGPDVPAGEVDAVRRAELVPGKRIRAARNEPVADHRDRPLAAVVDERLGATLVLVAPGGVDPQPEPDELLEGAVAELVVAERREEAGRAGELRQLNGRDCSAAGRLRPALGRVHDL